MAYYAALVSLKLTIKRLLESPKVSFLPPCQEISEFAYEEIGFLQQVLDGSEEQLLKNSPREVIVLTEFKTAQEQPLKMLGYADKEVGSLQKVLDRLEEQLLKNSTREEVVALTGQIRDAACKLEDSLEFHVSDQFFSRSESLGGGCPVILSPDTEEIKQRIDYIKETMEKLEKMIQELRNALPEEDCVVSPNIHFGGEGSKMVGFSDLFHEIKRRLGGPGKTSIWGMAGSGKSKLAEEIYKDQLDFKHFECCAWITIGPEHQLKKVLLHDKLHEEGYEILVEELRTSLSGRKYLIVVDDIWSQQDWDELKSLLPDNTQRHVLFTTRLRQIRANVGFGMCFLNEEESWNLLRQKVFGEECLCPFEFEKAGREIAKKCECLPLTIVTIANILSKSEKTPEYWNKVAEKKNSIFKDTVFTEAYEQMSKVLFPSYKYLPQHLKALFLYTAVFPPSSKIRASKLFRLWNVEGFLEPKYKQGYSSKKEKEYAMELLRHLVDSSVVLPGHWLLGEMKSWSLCSPFWYLCAREARKEKLFHVLDTYPNSFNESVESQ